MGHILLKIRLITESGEESTYFQYVGVVQQETEQPEDDTGDEKDDVVDEVGEDVDEEEQVSTAGELEKQEEVPETKKALDEE